jgi:hypothetical protein
MIPEWLPDFLKRESRRRASRHREIFLRAASEPTKANLIAATRVFGQGSFRIESLPNLIGAE